MTFVGHCMTGVAIGLVIIPPRIPRNKLFFALAGCAVIANLPDFAVPHWGHEDYLFSHSIFVNVAIILLLALATTLFSRFFCLTASWRVVLALALAWLSHLLLDTFYNHGLGLRMFWPFSYAALAIPIPWFHTIDVRAGYFATYNLRELFAEFLFYSIIVMAAVFLRWICQRFRLMGKRIHMEPNR